MVDGERTENGPVVLAKRRDNDFRSFISECALSMQKVYIDSSFQLGLMFITEYECVFSAEMYSN